MSKGRNNGWKTAHLVDTAGDLSWQLDDDRPPACKVPREGLSEEEQIRLHRRFDGAGPGKITEKQWSRVREAIAVCNTCPVLSECLAYALDPAHRVEGVWGGYYFAATDARARVTLNGQRAPITPPPPPPPPHPRIRSPRRTSAA